MTSSKWDARIRRANELASKYGFAAEGLRFYEHVAQFQKLLYGDSEKERGSAKLTNYSAAPIVELDPFLLLPRFPAFLSCIESNAPVPLAQFAHALRAVGVDRWHEILAQRWQQWPESPAAMEAPDALISLLFLQPYAEYFADHVERDPIHETPSRCPLCKGKPHVGVLRPEGEGAKRSLICSLCGTEWGYRRILCPACGEEDVHKLAVYTAQDFNHVRVEACDSCHSYIKTVDLTKNGHAVPVVDELATIPLNLWAAEHGYTKLQTNLLGV